MRSFLGMVLGVHTDEKAWRTGAQGEELVAARLKKLPDTWRVFHDISIDEADHNVDHIVIGPGGVFSLNAKKLTGTVWVAERAIRVNGHPTDFLRKARWEGSAVARRLSAAAKGPVEVRPVIVVIADQLKEKAQPLDVAVVARRKIVQWLEAQPPQLDPTAVAQLAASVGEPSTWR